MLKGSLLLNVICLFSNYFYNSINYLQHRTTNAVFLVRSRPFFVHSSQKKLFSKNNNNLQQPYYQNIHYLNQFSISTNKNFISSILCYPYNDSIFYSLQKNQILQKNNNLIFFTIRESAKILKKLSNHSRKAIVNLQLFLASTSIDLSQSIFINLTLFHDFFRKLFLASWNIIQNHHFWNILLKEFSKLSLFLASQYNLIIFFLYLIFFSSNRTKFKLIFSKSSFNMSFKSDYTRKRKSIPSSSKSKPKVVKQDARSAAIRQMNIQASFRQSQPIANNTNNIFNSLSSNSQDSIEETTDFPTHNQSNTSYIPNDDSDTEPEIDFSQQYQDYSEDLNGENPIFSNSVPPDQISSTSLVVVRSHPSNNHLNIMDVDDKLALGSHNNTIQQYVNTSTNNTTTSASSISAHTTDDPISNYDTIMSSTESTQEPSNMSSDENPHDVIPITNFRTRIIRKDANSFFSAMIDQKTRLDPSFKTTSQELRQHSNSWLEPETTLDKLARNYPKLSTDGVSRQITWKEYLSHCNQATVHAEDPHLYAVANILNLRICIYHKDPLIPLQIIVPRSTSYSTVYLYKTVYIHPHYDSLTMRQRLSCDPVTTSSVHPSIDHNSKSVYSNNQSKQPASSNSY